MKNTDQNFNLQKTSQFVKNDELLNAYCEKKLPLSNLYYKVHQIQNFNVSGLILLLSLPNALKPGVKLRKKMWLEQRRQAMLQLHLNDQQVYCPLRCFLLLEVWLYISEVMIEMS